jgi:hypothetical protein
MSSEPVFKVVGAELMLDVAAAVAESGMASSAMPPAAPGPEPVPNGVLPLAKKDGDRLVVGAPPSLLKPAADCASVTTRTGATPLTEDATRPTLMREPVPSSPAAGTTVSSGESGLPMTYCRRG